MYNKYSGGGGVTCCTVIDLNVNLEIRARFYWLTWLYLKSTKKAAAQAAQRSSFFHEKLYITPHKIVNSSANLLQ